MHIPDFLDAHFPRAEFESKVPCWCLTPDEGGFIHRFFDTPAISPSGRYVALFKLPFENRPPLPGELGGVWLVDLHTGKRGLLAETAGWEPQMGANINWGADDDALFFNDCDTQTWQPFAWKMDPLRKTKTRMDAPVYHASPDGRHIIAANMTSMRRTQPGYGVMVPDEKVRRNIGAAGDDGFTLTDTATGKTTLLPLSDLVARGRAAGLQLPEEEEARSEIYGFHSKFNPQSDRMMLSLRWFPNAGRARTDLFKHDGGSVRFAWLTLPPDASEIHCAVGPEEWEKGGHHATWYPDGRQISMNLAVDRDGVMRLMRVNANGTGYGKIRGDLVGSGHPTVHRDGVHILTDAYLGERFGDAAT
ncbi:MAG: hypothetical protein FWF96_07535, partial [Kiritimatiellaeota bacterium]|nr:hypothetical protein [Kiritimatiellota bacterium]